MSKDLPKTKQRLRTELEEVVESRGKEPLCYEGRIHAVVLGQIGLLSFLAGEEKREASMVLTVSLP